jgi:uncharacterized repeat protein (TIGR02059 family)
MFFHAYEFSRKISNVITYRDDIDDAVIKLGEIGGERIVAKSMSALRSKLNEINRSRASQGLALMTLAIPLSACGGGSDSSSVVETVMLSEVSGRAIDGYLIGSMVSLSSAPDVFVQTNSAPGQEGSFEGLFGSGSIIVTGGVDLATSKPFTGELRAPAPEVVTDADGNQTTAAIVVTPLTTIVEAVFTASAASAATGGEAAVSVAEATAQVAKGLGLSSSSALLTTDFVATGSAGMAKAAAQIASVISVVTASAGSAVASAVMTNIASKVSKAGEVGGKANILTNSTELASVFNEVRGTQAELFEDTPEGLDLDAFVDTISETVASVNEKVAQATSLKEIVATQQVLQDDIVSAFTIDADSDVPFNFEDFQAAVTAIDDNFEAILDEATTELDIYLAESDFDFDLDGEMDVSDIDLDVVAIDLDLIDSAISGAIDDDLLTGFIFGDVDEALLDGVIAGEISQEEVTAVLDDLPEYVIFEPIDETPIDEIPVDEVPVDEVPIDETPIDEIPVDEVPVDEIPVDEVPVDEIPVDEVPVDEIPVDEVPVDEIPVDEVPVDEIPVVAAPVVAAPDTTAPTFVAASASVGSKSITLSFSESLSGTLAAADFSVDINGTSQTPISVSGGGLAATLLLSHPIVSAATVLVTYTQPASGQMTDSSGNLLDTKSNLATTLSGADGPTVVSVGSDTVDGTYKSGDAIAIKIVFSEAVVVTGTPVLVLETGTTDQSINYTSGGGTNTLVFTYTVQDGDTSSDISYKSDTSLSGTIKSGSGADAYLTLPTISYPGSLDNAKAIAIDTSVPTITALIADAGTKEVKVTLSEAVSNTPDTTDFAVTVGGAAVTVSSLTKSIDNDEITLTLPNYLLNNQSIYVSYTKNSTVSKQLSDGANVVASVSGQGVTLTNDATTPAVLSVTTSKSDGSYKAGDTVDVSVQFSEVVAVTGTPTLTLETGATDRAVDYASGTGSDTLVFTYTVQSGDTSSDLTYASTASLAGTIKDLAGSSAVLTLPEIGAASALGYSSAIVVDTAAPYIISRVSEGGSTSLTLRFTEVVSGAPDGSDFAVVVDSASVTVTTFSLSDDGLSATLTLASAVGSSSTVTLDYTQSATDSKQLKDAAGNAIASIGDPVSVAVSRPTVTSILSDKASGSYAAGETIDIQLGLTEVVTVDTTSGTPTLKLELGATDRTASYQSGTGTNELTFRYVVQAGDLSSDLDYHATDPFKLNGGTIKDGDGNNVITTLPTAGSAGSLSSVEAIIIDASPPTISSVAANAGTKTVTLTMSEAVTGSPANGDFSVLVGSATNAATAVSVSGTSVTLTVTNVIANDATVTVGYTQNSTSSSQMKDTAGNAVATLSTAKSVTVTNDATAPTISSVTSSSTDATYKIGDIVNVQTVFSEAVTVTTASGTPQLTLETGTSDRAVSYSSGSGTDTLVFAYTVQSSDVSSDLDYKGTTSLALNNGTIKDLAGNTATITLNDPAAAGTTNSLADSKAIVIDGVLPTISSVAANAGTKTVTLTMSEAVTGSPANGDFSVLVGSATNAATAVSVSGTSVTLTVTNVIANDATVTVGYTQNSTSSSQMKDTAGNAVATLSTAKSVTVTNDATAPTISSVTSSSTDATYKIGDIVNVQTVFSEAVTVTTASGTPQLTLETGTSDRAVSYSSGSGTDTLVFAYTVQSSDVSSDLDYKGTTSLALNNGTIKDLAGNTATITLNDPAAALTTNSLADSKAIVIDGVLPTISSAAADGGSANVVLTMSEVVTGAPDTSDFTVLVGGSAKTVSGISDVSSATNSITLTLASVVPNDSIVTVDYDQNSSAVKKLSDGAGNNVATVGTPKTVTVTDDNISPTVVSITGTNGTYDLASPTVDLTVKFSESVNVQGTPTLQLETGTTDQKALYVSGTGSTDLLFRYTVQSGDSSGDLNNLSNTSLTFGTDGMVKDDALNTADLSLASIASLAFANDIIVSGV